MANTGTITLNFEAPDINLTGMGEFDISETFKTLFNENSTLKDEISQKIIEIVQNIKTSEVAENWTRKLEETLGLDKDSLNPTAKDTSKTKNTANSVDEKYKKFFVSDKNWLDYIKFFSTTDYKNFLKFFTINKEFQNFLKQFTPSITTFDKTIKEFQKSNSIFIKNIGEKLSDKPNMPTTATVPVNSQAADTVFSETPEVIISDFTDVAMDKLSKIFGGLGKDKLKSSKFDEVEKPQRGFLDKLLDNPLLIALGLSTIPALLKGLTGPALLAGGLIWMAINGIKGYFAAEDWGVSKLAGIIGGALGGVGSGVENMLPNAGEGALIGGGIGKMIGGPVGLIVGVLIGAALGGILGYFGGEAIAKQVDNIKTSLYLVPLAITKGMIGLLGLAEKAVAGGLKPPTSFFGKIGNFAGRIISGILLGVEKIIHGLAGIFPTFFGKLSKIILEAGEKTSVIALKAANIGGLSKLLGKALKFLFSKLWIVGSIISLYDAYQCFKRDDIKGGLISIASAVANVIPGFGWGISLLLDLYNQSRDTTSPQAKVDSSIFNEAFDKMIRQIPIISSLTYLADAFGAIAGGDWKMAGKSFALAGLGVFGGLFEMLGMGVSPVTIEESMNSGMGVWDAIAEGMGKHWLGKVGEWVGDWIFTPIWNALTFVGNGISSILGSIKNAWKSAVDGLADVLTKMGNWISETSNKILKLLGFGKKEKMSFGEERNQERIRLENQGLSKDVINARMLEMKSAQLTKQSKSVVAVKDSNPIRILPSQNDKAHSLSDGKTVLAEKGGVLDKKLDDVVNAIKALQIVMVNTNNKFANALEPVISQLKQISTLNGQQLQLLPALAQTSKESTIYPSSDVRDPAYDYRSRIHDIIARRI